MNRIISLCVFCLIVPAAGCGKAPPAPAKAEVMVDFSLEHHQGMEADIYMRLTGRGAALVVLGKADPRCFVFPTNPQEVERLVRNIAALASLRSEPDYYEDYKDILISYRGLANARIPGRGITVKYQSERQSGEVRLLYRERERNLVWKGVIEEIETVGFLQAARAFRLYEVGESALSSGEKVGAIGCYRQALETLQEWQQSRCTRYAVGIYEPEVGTGIMLPPVDDEVALRKVELGIRTVMGNRWEEIDQLPDEALHWVLEHLKRKWEVNTSDFVLQKSEKATVLGFSEVGRIFWQVANPTVSPDVVRDLLAAQKEMGE